MRRLKDLLADERGVIVRGGCALALMGFAAFVALAGLLSGDAQALGWGLGTLLVSVVLTVANIGWDSVRSSFRNARTADHVTAAVEPRTLQAKKGPRAAGPLPAQQVVRNDRLFNLELARRPRSDPQPGSHVSYTYRVSEGDLHCLTISVQVNANRSMSMLLRRPGAGTVGSRCRITRRRAPDNPEDREAVIRDLVADVIKGRSFSWVTPEMTRCLDESLDL